MRNTHPVFRHLFALLLMVFVAAASSHAQGADKGDDGSDCPCPTLMPLDLPPIEAVTITTASADFSSEIDKLYYRCDDFRVTQSDMDTFFKLTKKISAQDYMHAIDWVGCRAFGEIRFVDGTTANWGVMWSAAGFVRFPDGRETFLLCDACPAPFVH